MEKSLSKAKDIIIIVLPDLLKCPRIITGADINPKVKFDADFHDLHHLLPVRVPEMPV